MTLGCIDCKEKMAATRGLCHNCYRRCGEMVRKGKTTWDRLVAEGKALPSKVGTNRRQYSDRFYKSQFKGKAE